MYRRFPQLHTLVPLSSPATSQCALAPLVPCDKVGSGNSFSRFTLCSQNFTRLPVALCLILIFFIDFISSGILCVNLSSSHIYKAGLRRQKTVQEQSPLRILSAWEEAPRKRDKSLVTSTSSKTWNCSWNVFSCFSQV